MPLFPPALPTDYYWAHPALGATRANGSNVLVANTTFLIATWLPYYATITGMVARHGGTSAGNLDLGIYDSGGNRLAHTGSTACSGTFTDQSIAFSSNLSLSPGRYYQAIWVDNATDTYYQLGAFNIVGFGDFLTGLTPQAGGLLANFAAMGGTTTANAFYVAMYGKILGTGF